MSDPSQGALPEPVGRVRVTDADRQRTIDRLRVAAGEGAIDLDELEQRISHAWAARTVADLSTVTADLPADLAVPGATTPTHRRPLVLEDEGFRGHLTTYASVIGMLVVIWLLGGAGHPWPLYPALGWGVGLAGHYQSAVTEQRKRLARARAEGLTMQQLEAREAAEKQERRRQRQAGRRAELQQRHPPRDQARGQAASPPAGDAPSTRYVVAMFVDVVGSTSLNEALGDERWASVRRSFRASVAEAVTDHGGWEANCTGDGVLARFDEPSAAADAAVEVLRRFDRQRAETGFAPSVRIGVHSGDAVEDGDDIIGNVVNLAARVTDAAGEDEILVTEHVADHLDGRHTTQGRGLHSLKGVDRPRHLLALVWR